jgi:hypothetical protein
MALYTKKKIIPGGETAWRNVPTTLSESRIPPSPITEGITKIEQLQNLSIDQTVKVWYSPHKQKLLFMIEHVTREMYYIPGLKCYTLDEIRKFDNEESGNSEPKIDRSEELIWASAFAHEMNENYYPTHLDPKTGYPSAYYPNPYMPEEPYRYIDQKFFHPKDPKRPVEPSSIPEVKYFDNEISFYVPTDFPESPLRAIRSRSEKKYMVFSPEMAQENKRFLESFEKPTEEVAHNFYVPKTNKRYDVFNQNYLGQLLPPNLSEAPGLLDPGEYNSYEKTQTRPLVSRRDVLDNIAEVGLGTSKNKLTKDLDDLEYFDANALQSRLNQRFIPYDPSNPQGPFINPNPIVEPQLSPTTTTTTQNPAQIKPPSLSHINQFTNPDPNALHETSLTPEELLKEAKEARIKQRERNKEALNEIHKYLTTWTQDKFTHSNLEELIKSNINPKYYKFTDFPNAKYLIYPENYKVPEELQQEVKEIKKSLFPHLFPESQSPETPTPSTTPTLNPNLYRHESDFPTPNAQNIKKHFSSYFPLPSPSFTTSTSSLTSPSSVPTSTLPPHIAGTRTARTSSNLNLPSKRYQKTIILKNFPYPSTPKVTRRTTQQTDLEPDLDLDPENTPVDSYDKQQAVYNEYVKRVQVDHPYILKTENYYHGETIPVRYSQPKRQKYLRIPHLEKNSLTPKIPLETKITEPEKYQHLCQYGYPTRGLSQETTDPNFFYISHVEGRKYDNDHVPNWEEIQHRPDRHYYSDYQIPDPRINPPQVCFPNIKGITHSIPKPNLANRSSEDITKSFPTYLIFSQPFQNKNQPNPPHNLPTQKPPYKFVLTNQTSEDPLEDFPHIVAVSLRYTEVKQQEYKSISALPTKFLEGDYCFPHSLYLEARTRGLNYDPLEPHYQKLLKKNNPIANNLEFRITVPTFDQSDSVISYKQYTDDLEEGKLNLNDVVAISPNMNPSFSASTGTNSVVVLPPPPWGRGFPMNPAIKQETPPKVSQDLYLDYYEETYKIPPYQVYYTKQSVPTIILQTENIPILEHYEKPEDFQHFITHPYENTSMVSATQIPIKIDLPRDQSGRLKEPSQEDKETYAYLTPQKLEQLVPGLPKAHYLRPTRIYSADLELTVDPNQPEPTLSTSTLGEDLLKQINEDLNQEGFYNNHPKYTRPYISERVLTNASPALTVYRNKAIVNALRLVKEALNEPLYVKTETVYPNTIKIPLELKSNKNEYWKVKDQKAIEENNLKACYLNPQKPILDLISKEYSYSDLHMIEEVLDKSLAVRYIHEDPQGDLSTSKQSTYTLPLVTRYYISAAYQFEKNYRSQEAADKEIDYSYTRFLNDELTKRNQQIEFSPLSLKDIDSIIIRPSRHQDYSTTFSSTSTKHNLLTLKDTENILDLAKLEKINHSETLFHKSVRKETFIFPQYKPNTQIAEGPVILYDNTSPRIWQYQYYLTPINQGNKDTVRERKPDFEGDENFPWNKVLKVYIPLIKEPNQAYILFRPMSDLRIDKPITILDYVETYTLAKTILMGVGSNIPFLRKQLDFFIAAAEDATNQVYKSLSPDLAKDIQTIARTYSAWRFPFTTNPTPLKFTLNRLNYPSDFPRIERLIGNNLYLSPENAFFIQKHMIKQNYPWIAEENGLANPYPYLCSGYNREVYENKENYSKLTYREKRIYELYKRNQAKLLEESLPLNLSPNVKLSTILRPGRLLNMETYHGNYEEPTLKIRTYRESIQILRYKRNEMLESGDYTSTNLDSWLQPLPETPKLSDVFPLNPFDRNYASLIHQPPGLPIVQRTDLFQYKEGNNYKLLSEVVCEHPYLKKLPNCADLLYAYDMFDDHHYDRGQLNETHYHLTQEIQGRNPYKFLNLLYTLNTLQAKPEDKIQEEPLNYRYLVPGDVQQEGYKLGATYLKNMPFSVTKGLKTPNTFTRLKLVYGYTQNPQYTSRLAENVVSNERINETIVKVPTVYYSLNSQNESYKNTMEVKALRQSTVAEGLKVLPINSTEALQLLVTAQYIPEDLSEYPKDYIYQTVKPIRSHNKSISDNFDELQKEVYVNIGNTDSQREEYLAKRDAKLYQILKPEIFENPYDTHAKKKIQTYEDKTQYDYKDLPDHDREITIRIHSPYPKVNVDDSYKTPEDLIEEFSQKLYEFKNKKWEKLEEIPVKKRFYPPTKESDTELRNILLKMIHGVERTPNPSDEQHPLVGIHNLVDMLSEAIEEYDKPKPDYLSIFSLYTTRSSYPDWYHAKYGHEETLTHRERFGKQFEKVRLPKDLADHIKVKEDVKIFTNDTSSLELALNYKTVRNLISPDYLNPYRHQIRPLRINPFLYDDETNLEVLNPKLAEEESKNSLQRTANSPVRYPGIAHPYKKQYSIQYLLKEPPLMAKDSTIYYVDTKTEIPEGVKTAEEMRKALVAVNPDPHYLIATRTGYRTEPTKFKEDPTHGELPTPGSKYHSLYNYTPVSSNDHNHIRPKAIVKANILHDEKEKTYFSYRPVLIPTVYTKLPALPERHYLDYDDDITYRNLMEMLAPSLGSLEVDDSRVDKKKYFYEIETVKEKKSITSQLMSMYNDHSSGYFTRANYYRRHYVKTFGNIQNTSTYQIIGNTPDTPDIMVEPKLKGEEIESHLKNEMKIRVARILAVCDADIHYLVNELPELSGLVERYMLLRKEFILRRI